MVDRFTRGDRVTYPGYGYEGTFVRYERKHGVEYVIVRWAGRVYTSRYQPIQIKRIERRA